MGPKVKMMLIGPVLFCGLLLAGVSAAAPATTVSLPDAGANAYTEINLSNLNRNAPIVISIKKEQSLSYNWRAGDKVIVQAYVTHKDGKKEFLKDRDGKFFWEAILGPDREAALSIIPDAKDFSGRLAVEANGQTLLAPPIPQPFLHFE